MRSINIIVRLATAWLLLLISCSPLRAALPATSVWEVRPTVGSDTNGGGFDSTGTGTDMSVFNNKNAASCTSCQSATVNISTTDAVAAGTTTITSVTGNFSSALTGNIVHLSGGTGSLASGWYLATFVSSTSFTVDRTVATGTGISMDIGGALSTLGQVNTNAASGHITWVKATGTIGITASIAINYSSSASSNVSTQISGYTSTRGDGGVVTIQQTSGSSTMVNITSIGGLTFRNFVLDCNATNSTAMNIQGNNGQNKAENILVKGGCTANGIKFNNQGHACVRCTVENLGSGATTGFLMEQGNGPNFCIDCLAVGGTGTHGFQGAVFFCIRCIAANNTGGDGFSITTNSGWMFMCHSCIAYKNGRDGFRFAPSSPIVIENSVSYGNTGVGFNDTTGAVPAGGAMFNWNAYGSNTGGNLTNLVAGANDQTLTADPFTNGTSNNFAPNSTAGGGVLLKNNGFPGVLANGGTAVGGTGFLSIGALEPQPPTGGGQTGHATINF